MLCTIDRWVNFALGVRALMAQCKQPALRSRADTPVVFRFFSSLIMRELPWPPPLPLPPS